MSVVRRCPSCGTTRATPGECEACHAAQVRYFCTNHTPGVWLDAPKCPTCGARFGEPARRASTAAPPVPVRARAVEPARPPVSPSAPPPPYSRAAPAPRAAPAEAEPWSSRERLAPAGEEELEAGASRMALWQQLLRAAIRARYTPARTASDRERPPVGRGAAGCLVRLVLLMMLLFLALVVGLFLFGRSLLQGVVLY